MNLGIIIPRKYQRISYVHLLSFKTETLYKFLFTIICNFYVFASICFAKQKTASWISTDWISVCNQVMKKTSRKTHSFWVVSYIIQTIHIWKQNTHFELPNMCNQLVQTYTGVVEFAQIFIIMICAKLIYKGTERSLEKLLQDVTLSK